MSNVQVEKLKQMLQEAYTLYETLSSEEKAVIDEYMSTEMERMGE